MLTAEKYDENQKMFYHSYIASCQQWSVQSFFSSKYVLRFADR